MNTNNDLSTSTFSPYFPVSSGPYCSGVNELSFNVDDLIDLCNAEGVDGWFHIMTMYTTTAAAQLAAHVDARLNAGLKLYLEYGNEMWNFGLGGRWGLTLDLAAVEVGGFYGSYGDSRGFVFSRTSNVGTLITKSPHGLSAGQTIYLSGSSNLGSGTDPNTYTVNLTTASGRAMTFASHGPDCSNVAPPGAWFISNLTSTLAAWDSNTNLYGMQQRYCILQQMMYSNAIRAVLGDSKMQTRCRTVWADQMVNGGDPSVFDYINGAFPSHAVNYYIYGWAGAPYFVPTTTAMDQSASEAAIVADLNSAAGLAKYRYTFDSRVMGAAKYGLRSLWYESGPDTTAIGGGPSSSDPGYSAYITASVRQLQAQLDPGLATGVTQMLTDWFSLDGDLTMWFNSTVINPSDGDNNYYSCWGVTDSITDFTPGKMAGIISVQQNGVPITRNVVNGTIGATTVIDGGNAENTYTPGTPLQTKNQCRWTVWCKSAGTYSLTMNYAATGNSANVGIIANSAPVTAYQNLTINSGAYPDFTSASHVTTAQNIVLNYGPNCIELTDSGGSFNQGGVSVEWKTLNLTRVS